VVALIATRFPATAATVDDVVVDGDTMAKASSPSALSQPGRFCLTVPSMQERRARFLTIPEVAEELATSTAQSAAL
jgi:hypothetical protein